MAIGGSVECLLRLQAAYDLAQNPPTVSLKIVRWALKHVPEGGSPPLPEHGAGLAVPSPVGAARRLPPKACSANRGSVRHCNQRRIWGYAGGEPLSKFPTATKGMIPDGHERDERGDIQRQTGYAPCSEERPDRREAVIGVRSAGRRIGGVRPFGCAVAAGPPMRYVSLHGFPSGREHGAGRKADAGGCPRNCKR